jgi:hypothetical protein
MGQFLGILSFSPDTQACTVQCAQVYISFSSCPAKAGWFFLCSAAASFGLIINQGGRKISRHRPRQLAWGRRGVLGPAVDTDSFIIAEIFSEFNRQFL